MTKSQKDSITVDGVEYVKKGSVKGARVSVQNKKYVIVRTYSAGVFAGYLKKREGKEVMLQDARRIWYWKGAASLSQLAQSGTSAPYECKFPEPVDEVLLTEAIEVLAVTPTAKESIEGVPVWKT